MKSHTKYLWFNTEKRRQYIRITGEVEQALEESGIREGMVLVSAMHITAGVWVNDAEEGIIADIDEMLEKIAPYGPKYRHHRTGEDNGDAHLKSILVHNQVVLPVTGGRLDLCRVRRPTEEESYNKNYRGVKKSRKSGKNSYLSSMTCGSTSLTITLPISLPRQETTIGRARPSPSRLYLRNSLMSPWSVRIL